MNICQFIDTLKLVARDTVIEDIITKLELPLNRDSPNKLRAFSEFYHKHSDKEKALINTLIQHVADQIMLNTLGVIDNTLTLEQQRDRQEEGGKLVLFYKKSDFTWVKLNENYKLHTIYTTHLSNY